MFLYQMLEMTLLYFVLPPFLLSLVPIQLARFLSRVLPISSTYSMVLFSTLLALLHTPLAFMDATLPFHSLMMGVMLLLAIDMWRPYLWVNPAVTSPAFITRSVLVLLPACLLLLVDIVIKPAHQIVAVQMAAICVPADMGSIEASSIFLMDPVMDQFLAAFIMLIGHKGALIGWKGYRKEKRDQLS
ncbi:hypothetical protein [Pontibacillus salicampi]|uniref:hypothetical protein n=1 Tax=Pontibacillus salicampi TaxID=1449801 RepID=UPI0036710D9D